MSFVDGFLSLSFLAATFLLVAALRKHGACTTFRLRCGSTPEIAVNLGMSIFSQQRTLRLVGREVLTDGFADAALCEDGPATRGSLSPLMPLPWNNNLRCSTDDNNSFRHISKTSFRPLLCFEVPNMFSSRSLACTLVNREHLACNTCALTHGGGFGCLFCRLVFAARAHFAEKVPILFPEGETRVLVRHFRFDSTSHARRTRLKASGLPPLSGWAFSNCALYAQRTSAIELFGFTPKTEQAKLAVRVVITGAHGQ